ncbi:MAG: ABC transporter permease subunit [Pseudomonadota bacterium]
MAQTGVGAGVRGGAPEEGGGGLSSILYNQRIRGAFFQIALLVGVVGLILFIALNTIENLNDLNKKSGFAFLNETAGFKILTTPGTWAVDFDVGSSTYLDIFWVGVINTAVVSLLGILAATVIGFIMGVFRLSSNIILSGFSTVYIEVLRNIPLLLQLFIWYKVVVALFPSKRGEPLSLFFGAVQVDKSGFYSPYPLPQAGFEIVGVTAALALVAWIGLSMYNKRRQAATGQTLPVFWIGLGLLVLAPVVVFYLVGQPLEWEQPERGRFGFLPSRGMVLVPEMFAVWVALSLYTSAFIAEIVRAGILAVNKGQTEASSALGLRSSVTLRQVVIPQALRVIIPPLTSQYLNLTKNSSLAVAIAYPDVVSVFAGTALNQVGQELEMIFMMMLVYLVFSLTLSLVMNWYNRRIALVER